MKSSKSPTSSPFTFPKSKDEPSLIGAKELAMMKSGVILINTARGGVIDEDALARRSEQRPRIRSRHRRLGRRTQAAPRSWSQHPRVVALPHVGAQTLEGQGRVGDEVAEILKDFFHK
jgi:D-3-phosphoglycerate dehydrogenase